MIIRFGSFNLIIALVRLGRVTESKALEMSNDASQVSFPKFLDVLSIDDVIVSGSIVLWSLRPAKLELDKMLWDLKVDEIRLFRILVKIFLVVSMREIGLVSVRR